MSLAHTITQNAVGSVVGTIVGITVGLIYKRLLKRENERVERIIKTVEDLFGVAINIPQVQKGTMMNFATYRKGFATGFGVIFIGILTWVSTSTELKTMLEQIVPATFVPLVPVILGGIATVVAVVKSPKNADKADTASDTPAVTVKTTPAATPVVASATIAATVPAQTSPTKIVDLLPAPEMSYM